MYDKYIRYIIIIISYQLELMKMRADLVDLNHCAVLFLIRAAVNLWWYYNIYYIYNYTYISRKNDWPL